MENVFEELRKIKIKIVNIKGSHDAWPNTPDGDCQYWIDYYKKYYNKDTCKCAVCGKKVDKLNGGHVFRVDELHLNKPGIYLVPLCDSCNAPLNEEIMETEDENLFEVTDICKFNDVKDKNIDLIKKILE